MHELARKVTLTCVYRTVDGATAVHVEARSAVVLPSLLLGARGPGFRERHGVQPGVYTPADPRVHRARDADPPDAGAARTPNFQLELPGVCGHSLV